MADGNSTTPLPWKVRFSLNFVASLMNLTRRPNGTINRSLLNLMLEVSKTPPRSSNTVHVSDVTVDSSRNLWFRQFVPTKAPVDSKLPLIIFIHGGGFSYFSPDLKQFDQLCRLFAEKVQAVVISVNYRLTPEHKFPAQYDDGFDVLKFLDQKHPGTNFSAVTDLSRCYVAGDSAGGNIAHHVVRRYAESAEISFTKLRIVGLIAMQPFLGGEERTESEMRLGHLPMASFDRRDWHWKVFLPEGEDRDHEAVNVFGPKSSDLSGLERFPDTLVFIGGQDALQDWQKRYCEGLKRSGKTARLVEYENAFHGFYGFSELPETQLMVEEIRSFVNSNKCQ